jgi:hypothetical protein
MTKISIEEVESTLLRQKIEPAKVSDILKDLRQVMEELEADKEKLPKEKWEYVIVLNDPSNELAGKELSGFVVQKKEADIADLVLTKIAEAAGQQNEYATKKKTLITSVRDMFAAVKPKFLKEKGIRIKTKEAVRVLITK